MRVRGQNAAKILGTALAAVLLTSTSAALAQAPYRAVSSTRPGTIDFTDFVGRSVQTNGPVDLGQGVTWSVTSEGWIGDMPFGLRTNGYWDSGRAGFAGLNIDNSAMLFEFDAPVASVGAFVNYAPVTGQGPIPTIEALDRFGRVFDSFTLDVRTPNAVNDGQFLGFEHESNDIHSFRYRARYGVLDDLEWSRRGLIPAPSSLAMLAVGALGFARRRRRES
ncbi:MAG: PEP-CTERM sorting domain-containing protein [Phycisphaerales bacterium]|nr:PEP-CTERM sorting domain-containing protein [Phycisphaerales bacterium]